MALTQVSTGGIKDGQVHTADLADGQVTVGKLHADALDHTYTLGADGSNHYTFTGEGLTGAVNDPTLYLTRGKTYRFVNGNSAGAHPFRIQTTVNGSAGTEYNTGVTNNGGAGGSTIVFEVPHDAPDVLYYQCTSHGSMGGILYVTGALADGTVTTAKLADDAVTDAKLANSINSAIAANTAKDLTALSASNLTSGTVPDARFPATLPAVSGANLTNLPASGKATNLVINGAMQVAQRGTSTSSWSGIGYPACDRQKTLASYGGTWTISQSTEAPSDNGFTKSTKYDCTTAVTSLNANAYLQHYYRIEGQDLQGVCKGTSNAKALTLSFWVKTNKTGTYNVEAIDQDNSRLCTFSYTVSDTNWNKYTVVFPADTTGAFNNDNGVSLDIGWWLVAGSTFNSGSNQNTFGSFTQANRAPSNVNLADSTSNEWYITGIQLEVGDTATDFEHRSFAQELALCQRYFYMHAFGAYVYTPNRPDSTAMGMATQYTTTAFYGIINFPVQMRAHPSFVKSLGTDRLLFYYNTGAQGFNDITTQDFGVNSSIIKYYDSLNSSAQSGWVQLNNNSAYVGFDAEL